MQMSCGPNEQVSGLQNKSPHLPIPTYPICTQVGLLHALQKITHKVLPQGFRINKDTNSY